MSIVTFLYSEQLSAKQERGKCHYVCTLRPTILNKTKHNQRQKIKMSSGGSLAVIFSSCNSCFLILSSLSQFPPWIKRERQLRASQCILNLLHSLLQAISYSAFLFCCLKISSSRYILTFRYPGQTPISNHLGALKKKKYLGVM